MILKPIIFIMKNILLIKNITKILIFFTFFFNIIACGIYKPVDARKVSPNVNERARENIREGRGFRIFDSNRNKSGGVFQFASSNEMWRATINLLDFAPFSNVDYSGGIIITDWYNGDDLASNESIKITVKFLSNEIRADGIEIIIHKKICDELNRCKISKLQSDLSNDIKVAILKDAAILKEQSIEENPNQDYKTLDEAIDR